MEVATPPFEETALFASPTFEIICLTLFAANVGLFELKKAKKAIMSRNKHLLPILRIASDLVKS